MTFEQLRIFLAVVEHMHFTRAAEALYLTQPSVSAAIQSLEEQYDVLLFNRVGRRIELTQAGRLLQREAQKILEQVNLTEQGLREFNNLQRGELTLGASQTIGNYWLPGYISRFKQQYPGVQINCTLGNTEAISTGAATGQFDLGMVEGEVNPTIANSLEQQVIGGDRLCIVVGRSHPWFDRKTISLADLVQTPWVMRESGSGTRQFFEQVLQQQGIELEQLPIALELTGGEMVKASVESGVGAAALSELTVAKELKLGTLRSPNITKTAPSTSLLTDLSRSFKLLKSPERFQTRISKTFEQMLLNQ